jgi:uncharacterized PurR-regulated membrane protein YhhQ (DUF165 family)
MRKALGALCAAAYIATIWLANYLVSHYGIVDVGFGLMAPAAVYAVGVAFTMRDFTQDLLGRKVVIGCIAAGCVLSYLVSPTFALASAVAFAASESADFAIYTPLRERDWLGAVTVSNIVGACIDSALFLYIAFNSEAFFEGQVVGKLAMTAVAVGLLSAGKAAYGRRLGPVEVSA